MIRSLFDMWIGELVIRYINLVAEASPVPVFQYAMRVLPSLPDPDRFNDNHGEKRAESEEKENGHVLGICRIVSKTNVNSEFNGATNAAFRN